MLNLICESVAMHDIM